jgi:hypothetical protein
MDKEIEEAAERYVENFAESVKSAREIGFIDGANYQAERMYGESDMIRFMQFIISNKDLNNTSSVSKTTAKYYIEQFKNK